MDKYYFDGVIRLKIKIDKHNSGSRTRKKELEASLEHDFMMNTYEVQHVLKKHIEKIKDNKSLFVLFPYDPYNKRSKLPLIFIETDEDNYIYIYENDSTSNPHYDCFILFRCHEGVFPKLKSIFDYLEKVFSEKEYILNFYRPDDIEGYLIDENKELVHYYQKLSYKTKKNLPWHVKIVNFFKSNKILLYIIVVAILAIIATFIFYPKDMLFMNVLSFKDIIIGLSGFSIGHIINLIISYNEYTEEFISSKDLIAYLVTDKDIPEQTKETASQIDNINEEELSIK